MKVENDHKPLVAILQKPLSQASKRLQDLMMRYHRYDVNFAFVKGADFLIANTLSRAHRDYSGNDQEERARIMHVNVFGDQTSNLMRNVKQHPVMVVCRL